MSFAQRLQRIVDHRAVLWTLVKRDLRIRYARSALGYLWTLIDPLSMTLVYWFVFGVIYQIGNNPRQEGRSDHIPFVLFMVSGVLAWNWFSNSVNETARALYAERLLVRSTNLPRELWVIRVVLSKGIEHLLSLPILIAFMLYFRYVDHAVILNWKLVFWLPALVLELVLCIGIGLVMAPVTALVDDFVRIVRIVLRIGFYFTPIVYSLNYLHQRGNSDPSLKIIARILEFNPLSAVNDLYREGMLVRETPPYHIWLYGTVISVAWLILGMWVFRRLEKPILKEI
ncbi:MULTISPECIES: ABC transporter permease [Allobranchiibius]|uniref:Transport permease protein n=1 Tax=Allobranchiibius huperziae TaxID=1874116 RepID=A0A853DD56_9MICO|nr:MULTISPECIES: ABC transporter permease [Allobranchiibius]MBO1765720.1 ABC transporter permease [Allobranchiibius sp. GilTou38]NYJ73933.1 ABC-2 type transport system permease protein [Allobranchiibius huperziae]UIJ34652.1 ABC transporter permease [Allobranchiibius sp. GilTou73]